MTLRDFALIGVAGMTYFCQNLLQSHSIADHAIEICSCFGYCPSAEKRRDAAINAPIHAIDNAVDNTSAIQKMKLCDPCG